ncbi:hypothetical protein A5757_11955 [Mycobacterium sp. 852013-51886_SCH5428379]|uniref:hypothetical protein n=1 Tax=Mycobacterium sp. 852013-51886_SCH5428379 TaxID=1834111 RepID=UPI0007FD7F3C|nr:hypothetical protein [Mycobacterium sp. 852013-51886_SCH5428379]OBB59793.1 hypothetical protein A5757_11955 [Mycobacterium sp. 852013-51886_SCH5428379]
MLTRTSSSVVTGLAYLVMLTSFVWLGLFVAALAHGSQLAALAGAALAASLVLGVAGFRAAAAKRAEENEDAGPDHKLTIWSKTLEPEQVDRYLEVNRAKTRANV